MRRAGRYFGCLQIRPADGSHQCEVKCRRCRQPAINSLICPCEEFGETGTNSRRRFDSNQPETSALEVQRQVAVAIRVAATCAPIRRDELKDIWQDSIIYRPTMIVRVKLPDTVREHSCKARILIDSTTSFISQHQSLVRLIEAYEQSILPETLWGLSTVTIHKQTTVQLQSNVDPSVSNATLRVMPGVLVGAPSTIIARYTTCRVSSSVTSRLKLVVRSIWSLVRTWSISISSCHYSTIYFQLMVSSSCSIATVGFCKASWAQNQYQIFTLFVLWHAQNSLKKRRFHVCGFAEICQLSFEIH